MELINFKDIESSHLVGEWRVQSKILSQSDPDHVFAKANKHSFSFNGDYSLENGDEHHGHWDMNMKDDIIRTPLIRFALKNHGTTHGIITRLLFSKDKKHGQLTIYLSTGLELVLLKK